MRWRKDCTTLEQSHRPKTSTCFGIQCPVIYFGRMNKHARISALFVFGLTPCSILLVSVFRCYISRIFHDYANRISEHQCSGVWEIRITTANPGINGCWTWEVSFRLVETTNLETLLDLARHPIDLEATNHRHLS